jgi:G:T-mismatch repair DNA endonuclease (very short patch repair protein)
VRNEAALRELGFDVLVLWECETEDGVSLERRLLSFLEG